MQTVTSLLEVYRFKGALAYQGEGVSQLQHAWQCGQLARQAGASLPLQLAAWLHDVGHMLTDLEDTPTLQGVDDMHEKLGADLLAGLWGDAVAQPVRLHVQAKRYLVATHPSYRDKLSIDSVRSLALQGGAMRPDEAAAFEALPFAQDAQRLRVWDDQAKRRGWFNEGPQRALDELGELIQAFAESLPADSSLRTSASVGASSV